MAKEKRVQPTSYSGLLEELESYRQKKMVEDNPLSDTAMRWYINVVNSLYNYLPEDLDRFYDGTRKYPRSMRIGDVMAYGYTAVTPISKHFPYYDLYPLIIVLDTSPKHFLGVNMHFLPPLLRQRFFDQCRRTAAGTVAGGRASMSVEYTDIKEEAALEIGMACIRRYRFDAIRTRLIRVPSDQWLNAVNLPTMRIFPSGITPNKAWRDSLSKARKKGWM